MKTLRSNAYPTPSVDPSEDGTYTVPVIQTPDGTYISDSYKIAAYIEEKYPSPPNMHLNHPIQDRFRKSMISFMTALQPIYMLGVPQNILADASIDFFRTTRHKDLGMSLEEFFTKESPGAFERAEPHLHNITALLKEDTSGPFFLGQMVSYTDFIWAADLLFWKKFGEKEFQEILRRGGDTEVHATFLDGLNKWTARND